MEHEKVFAISGRIGDGKIFTKGSKDICATCRNIVWVSDSTMKALKDHEPDPTKIEIVCVQCFLAKPKEVLDECKIMPQTSEQKSEIFNETNKQLNN